MAGWGGGSLAAVMMEGMKNDLADCGAVWEDYFRMQVLERRCDGCSIFAMTGSKTEEVDGGVDTCRRRGRFDGLLAA